MMHPLPWLLLLCVTVARCQVDVETEYGTVRGQTILLDDGISVNSFKAIPFATPPVGPLRFEPPQKAVPWDGVFIADTLGDQCPQNPGGALAMTHPGWDRFDEDCLHLNIFTPEDMSPENPYPVMVWFHGGAYVSGGNIQYNGHFLASHNTVVVVPNYRLSVFGFLATPDGYIKGNAGMYDQVMALQFVQDNIANFGGDPSRVTIFGQSAGASSSALHILSPASQDLFQQAICESGADTNFWTLNWPGQIPENYVYQTALRLNCTRGNDTVAMIDCIRDVHWDELRQNSRVLCRRGHFCQGYAPTMDGEGGFMPDYPDVIRETGNFVQGPLITGICRDDGALYTAAMIPEANDGGFTREEFLRYLENRLLVIWRYQLTEKQTEDALRAVDFYYSPWPHLNHTDNNRDAFNRMITDAAFGLSSDRQALWQSEYVNDTYFYVQGFRSPNASMLYKEWMGSPHNCELPYVWGYPRLLHNQAVRDDQEMHFDIIDWVDPIDIDYTHYFQKMWTNFAKVGNPTPEPVDAPEGNEPTTWPSYSKEHPWYIEMDYDIVVDEEYRQRDNAFFREYISNMVDIPVREHPQGEPDGDGGRELYSDWVEVATALQVLRAIEDRVPQEVVDRYINYLADTIEDMER